MQEANITEKPNILAFTTDRPMPEVLKEFFNAAQADKEEKDSAMPMDLEEAERALKDNKNIEVYRGRIISIDFSSSDEEGITLNLGFYAAFNGKEAVDLALRRLKENYWEEL